MDEIARCYQLLGLPVDASQEEVKRAYRDLVRVWHPDRFSHDERLQTVAQDKLKEINGAYETLNAKFFNDSISPPPQEEASQAAPEPEFAPAEDPAHPSAPIGSQRKAAIWIAVSLVCALGLVASGIFYWKHPNSKAMAPSEPVYHSELKDFELILHAGSATFIGNWTLGKVAKDRNNKTYHYAGTVEGVATATATFTPLIPATGNYDVYVWYSQGPKRSTRALFQIFHDGTNVEANVNQTVKGGRWNLIASNIRLLQGTNGYVRLSNSTGEADRVVIADAIRFVYSSNESNPKP
jgi:DnaJ domain